MDFFYCLEKESENKFHSEPQTRSSNQHICSHGLLFIRGGGCKHEDLKKEEPFEWWFVQPVTANACLKASCVLHVV